MANKPETNLETVMNVLPAVIAVLPQLKKSGTRDRARAKSGDKIDMDTLMQLIPTITAALPAMKAIIEGKGDTSATELISKLQTVLAEYSSKSNQSNVDDLSSKISEILPGILNVLAELKANQGRTNAENFNFHNFNSALSGDMGGGKLK